MAALIAGLLASASLGQSGATPPSTHRTQRATLKDWAIARCLAQGATGEFARDAAVSASALLERGTYDIAVYEAIESLVSRQLAKQYGGSVPSQYVTLKCLDLSQSEDLDRLVQRAKSTTAR